MVYVFLAEGFEEIEAVSSIDVLRRAGVDVKTVGIGGKNVRGSHGILLEADLEEAQTVFEGLEMIMLPGGMPGTTNLGKSETVQSFIDYAYERGLWIGAICAAPSILGKKGMLKGKKAVSFPGFEKDLAGAEILSGQVCEDGNIITANGPGAGLPFAFALAAKLKGNQRAEEIRANMQVPQI